DDRPITGVGFRPRHLLVKRQDTAPAVWRTGSVNGDVTLPTLPLAPYANGTQAFLSDGFELGTDAAVNTSGKVYFWSSFRDVASMDLAVTATVSDSTPNERDLVTYTIRVRNLGPENATGVALQDTLPRGVTYRTYVPSRGVYDPATGIWTLGSVVSGDSATLAIAAVVDTGTTGTAITNLASLSALDQTDSNNSDDQGSATIRVQASDLALRMEADHPSPRETDPVAFTLTVVNRGPDAATGITVRDSLPAGLDFVSATPSRGAYLPPATWSLGSLAAGDSATLTVRTTVALGTGGTTITHHAAIQGSDQADPRAGDRADSATVYVALAPGIQVTAAQPTVTEWPGTQTVRLMTLTVLNSSAAASRLDRLVLSNRTAGSGTPAELDAELGDVRLYRDDGDGSFAPSADSLLAQARAGGGAVAFDTLGVSVPAGSLVRLHLVLDVPLTARDGDVLDLGIDGESDVGFDQVVTFLNPWPVNPAGGVTVDGMAAAQITVRAHPDSLISVGAVRVLALDATLPPNGYEPDVLKGVSLVNRGDAAPSLDLRRVELWGDGGDGVFDAGSGDDFPLGVTAWNGSAWTVSGLFIPIPAGGRRIFASADVADSAGIGRRIELGFEGPGTTGVDVSSGNDGPLDAAVAGSRVITIGPGPSRIVAAASPQTAGVLLPGESGITVFQFSLQNLSAQPETLTSVTFQNTSSGPGTPSERDAEWLPLSLRLETDPIATSSFSGGRAVFGGLTVTLGPGTTTRFQVASGASLKARDGDLLDVSIPGAPDLIFSKGVLLTGAWPLAPDGSFTVDGMSLAQIAVAGQATPDLLTGSARNNALDVVIPANGYQTDTLQFLVVQNHGDAQPLLDIPRVEAWADDGDGVFEPDPASGTADRLLGPLYFIGGVWALGGFSLPVPPGGQRVFISCDVARDATESRTVRFSLPASPIVGLGMASSNDGPRDGELLNPVTMTISTIDRMTFTTQNIAAGSAAPGDTQIVLAHLVGRNTYADSTKTLTGLTLTNLTRTPAVASQSELDGEVQSLQLRADAPNGPVLATGYFLVGRAAFSGFSWSVPPGASRDLYLTGDLSSTAATDGDVIGAAVNVESALQFADFTSLSARFPLNSGAAWTVDGMTADQIVNWGAPAVSLSPDDVPTLALDWTVPRNGYRDDVLEGVRLANDGTATAADLRELHLWKDGGDGTFDRGTGDDVDLGAMSFIAGRWSSATLSEPLGRAGVRLFASVAPSSAAADSASVRLVIPIGGLTVTSANDGPTDRPIANPGALLMSTSHLLASLVMGASVSVVGDAVTAHMTVRNLGLQAITAITPSALKASGDGRLSVVGGPTPASLDLAPGTEGTFDWTLRADSTGTTTLSADASGFELGTGILNQTLPASTSPHQIFAGADSLLMYSTESMPFSVNRGQTGVVPLTLTFTHPGGSAVSDILLRNVSIRLENEAGDPVVPRSLLARVGANEGTSVYAELRALPESGSRIDLTLSPPVRVRGGGGTGAQASLRLSLDILDTTWVASAEDAISGSPVRIALDRGQPYPLLSGLTRIVAAATELDVAVVSDAARTAARGQSAVTLLTVQATNPGPVGLGPEIRLSTFGVTLVDSTRTPLSRPSRVLKRIRVTAGTQLVTDRSLTASDDTLITLDLSPDLTLALNTPVTISIAADIADSADVGVVRLRLADSTTFEVRNTNTGTLLPTIQQAPPIEGPAVAVVARSDSLRARAVPGLPPSLTVGSTGVLAMTVLLSHPGSAWTGTITLGQLMVRCRDQLSNTLPPAAFVDRARVLLRGVEVGLVTNFPSTRDAFALPLSGVTLAPGEQVPAGLFQMTIGGPDILAHDANLGTPVAAGPDIGAEFPLSSGITALEAPARDLAVGFEDRMPAVLVADGAEIPAARLALRNTSPNGQIRLDHLVLLAADPALTAIALGDAVSRVRAYTADTLWADTGDLPLGTTAGLLTAATTLVLPGGAPVPIELRITLRPGAPFDGLRVGCRADGIGVVQPGSPLLAVAVAAENGQSFPFWTQAASAGATTLTDSYANFPNPFAAGRQTSRFVYYLRGDARVRLDLWTTRGDRVRTLLDDVPMARGLHQDVTWDGRNERGTVVVNGAYLAEIRVRYQDGSTERMLRKVAVVR
ncbi:MAG: DUF11 domain-containing protein, partial [Candidatus Eisenbacteria bacterium]